MANTDNNKMATRLAAAAAKHAYNVAHKATKKAHVEVKTTAQVAVDSATLAVQKAVREALDRAGSAAKQLVGHQGFLAGIAKKASGRTDYVRCAAAEAARWAAAHR